MNLIQRGIFITGGINVGAGIGSPGVAVSGGGGGLLPFTDDFNRADGAIGNGWTGATWTISGNKAINTPTLGAELFANGGFGADTDWTKGTGWTIAAGVASHAAGSAGTLSQTVGSIGNWYRLVFTLLNRTAGTFTPLVLGNFPASYASDGTYTGNKRATTGSTAGITTGATAAGDVDNLSLKQLTLNTLFATKDFSRNDVDVSVKLTLVTNNICGVVLNLDSTSSPANFILGLHDGTNARLVKCVAGTYTELVATGATYSAGAALRVTKSGSAFRLFYSGVQVGADQTVSDVGIISNTLHGMFNTYELNGLDDFSIAAV